jgi:hypothetical protein
MKRRRVARWLFAAGALLAGPRWGIAQPQSLLVRADRVVQ